MTQNTVEKVETPNVSISNFPQPTSRFGAFVIDSILCGLFATPLHLLFYFIFGLYDNYVTQYLVASVSTFIIGALYFPIFNSKGQTLGHKVVGIKIEKEDGTQLTFADAFVRYIVFSILNSIPFLNFINLLALIDAKKQNLYDKIGNVVHRPINEQPVVGYGVTGCSIGCGCINFILSLIFLLIITLGTLIALSGDTEFSSALDDLNKELQRTERDLRNQISEEESVDTTERMNERNTQDREMRTLDEITRDLDSTMDETEDRSLEDSMPVNKAEFMLACVSEPRGSASNAIQTRYCECLYNADLKGTSVSVCMDIIAESTR